MNIRILFSFLALVSLGHSQAVDPKVAEAVAGNDRAYEAAHAKGDAAALAIHVKKDDKWKIRHLVETPLPATGAELGRASVKTK